MMPVLLSFLSTVALSFAPDPMQDPTPQALASQSEMIFRGTVKLIGSATVPADDSSDLAVVHLDELLHGPTPLRSFVGKDITVRLKSRGAVQAGESRLFFANPWIFADSIGVSEVGSVAQPAGAPPTLAGEVSRLKAAAAEAELKERLDKAPLVVLARVEEVQPLRKPILSEHDPQWSEARLAVKEVLKGTAAGPLRIVFPASTDVMWFKVPKPQAGQENVFLLRSGLVGLAPGQVGLSEPKDMLPAAEAARVKALLGR